MMARLLGVMLPFTFMGVVRQQSQICLELAGNPLYISACGRDRAGYHIHLALKPGERGCRRAAKPVKQSRGMDRC